ncbi:hypothetical protein K439DRAFT_1328107 [Ramaria rubella]|nr:hypothetical protein K439DRAFT_1328107 [Ramaria rubella]
MRYEFLPPYSPDLNPIEEAFSAIKAHLRWPGNLARVAMTGGGDDAEVYVCLHEAVWSVTAQNALGWFQDCGY